MEGTSMRPTSRARLHGTERPKKRSPAGEGGASNCLDGSKCRTRVRFLASCSSSRRSHPNFAHVRDFSPGGPHTFARFLGKQHLFVGMRVRDAG